MAIHLTPEANPTVQEGTLYVDSATGEFNVAGRTVPHIIPGVLYPAVSGNDLSGTALGGSYVYGTEHTDGRKYYYTDIKGSKPIKDPRIGGYFGSQRHKFKSLQLLEQETATHGKNVYSVDGREWCRAVDGTGTWSIDNSSNGNGLVAGNDCTDIFLEITGYFNNLNMLVATLSDAADDIDVKVNGSLSDGVEASSTIGGKTTVSSPLGSRYVDRGSVINVGWSETTPQIITIRYEIKDTGTEWFYCYGIELIAQDTTSTANRSKIQIPSQNVVSYGKKFNVSGTPHYDPFSAKTDGSAWTSPTSGTNNANSSASWPTNIDTSTSLGLDKWVDGSNYYRPYNGGRVVRWVDSSGVIKTSVTLMPPNARSIGNSSSLTNANAKANASVANDTFYPTMEAGAIDHSLSEVAKTFHYREFGNGAANGGTGATYADASMLNTDDSIAYVMDDGLTSLSADDVTSLNTPANALNLASDDRVYITFIGTGISIYSPNWAENANAWHHIAQNLPYGSHILRIFRDSSNNSTILLDGVEVKGSTSTAPWKNPSEITFHQPKKPPIPEDACVIADYMLMADFVRKTVDNIETVSKGVRKLTSSRDCFYDGNSFTFRHAQIGWSSFNIDLYHASGANNVCRIPSFSINALQFLDNAVDKHQTFKINGSSVTSSRTGTNLGSFVTASSNVALGMNVFSVEGVPASGSGNSHYEGWELVSPIHTSHHYQAFETPFLHELVGGDRNMEQTNLVVSSDGKTWDEVTRDTSYIGSMLVSVNTDTETQNGTGADQTVKFDEIRGTLETYRSNFTKDFTMAYDRLICLKDGQYNFSCINYNSDATHTYLYLNNNYMVTSYSSGSDPSNNAFSFDLNVKRGDYVQLRGGFGTDSLTYNSFQIKRI